MNETTPNECVTIGNTPNRNEHEHLKDTTKRKHPKNFVDLTGLRKGRLTVLREAEPYKRKTDGSIHVRWHCQCDCGNKTVVLSRELRHGGTVSCGCYRTENNRNLHRGLPYQWILTTLKGRKLNSLTYDELLEFTSIKFCHYCNDKIQWNEYERTLGKRSSKYNLDRKDNAKGYSKDNCVVCCSACNYLKGDKFTYDEMIELGKVLRRLREERHRRSLSWIEYYKKPLNLST